MPSGADLEGGDRVGQVVGRAGGAGEVEDVVDRAVDRDRARRRCARGTGSGGCPSRWATFRRFPVSRLSTQTTSCPSARNRSQRWEPTKPAPPVITVLDMLASPEPRAIQPDRAAIAEPCSRPFRPGQAAPRQGTTAGAGLGNRRPRVDDSGPHRGRLGDLGRLAARASRPSEPAEARSGRSPGRARRRGLAAGSARPKGRASTRKPGPGCLDHQQGGHHVVAVDGEPGPGAGGAGARGPASGRPPSRSRRGRVDVVLAAEVVVEVDLVPGFGQPGHAARRRSGPRRRRGAWPGRPRRGRGRRRGRGGGAAAWPRGDRGVGGGGKVGPGLRPGFGRRDGGALPAGPDLGRRVLRQGEPRARQSRAAGDTHG